MVSGQDHESCFQFLIGFKASGEEAMGDNSIRLVEPLSITLVGTITDAKHEAEGLANLFDPLGGERKERLGAPSRFPAVDCTNLALCPFL